MALALIIALPFLGICLPLLFERLGRSACAFGAGLAPLAALVLLISKRAAVFDGEVEVQMLPWLPELGLNLSLRLDGLGFLFALLILGIGLLVILYARYYLSKHEPMGRFYGFFLLFMGAMLGVVLSENLLLMLMFWELTSLSSFLLIGFWNHRADARQGARMALAVTGGGGLALLAGILLIGHIVGSYELSTVLVSGDLIRAHALYPVALILVLLGVFTKSAQFPFHFWLPQAMAAPTPVSAFLHSATMVKAGVFLLARLYPALSDSEWWFYLVSMTGLATLLIGAVMALFQHDLKGLLAYSTISHLGLITLLFGLDSRLAAVAAIFHIINHATFKAALFMSAGIVDHEAHTRDIKRLGGLRHLMPVTFTIATVAALSMAGIPFFNGFLSKEMMLEEAWNTGLVVAVLATLGALFSVAYSFRFVTHVFLGPKRNDYPGKPHDPGFGMWAAPALLAVLVVLIGLFPQTMVGPLVATVSGAVIGSADLPYYSLSIWHGFTPALFMSVIAVGVGLAVLKTHAPLARRWDNARRPEAKVIFDAIVESFAARQAQRFTLALHDGAMTRYLAIFTVAVVAFGVWAFTGAPHAAGTRETLPMSVLPVVGFLLLVAATVALVVLHRQRYVSLIVISIIGIVIALGFIYFSAPDLAMTQLTVEVVTIILLLLALNYLPKDTPVESSVFRRARDGVIAVVAGAGATALTYAILVRDLAIPSISGYHLENSYSGGGGTNVVNVILVDFRGFDTMGEIIVLGIAAFAIFALVEGVLHGPASRRLANYKPDRPVAHDRHPLMMVVATRVALPIALTVGVYIFLRGHNEPGGGFIAGLVVAIALLMQYMASGFAWSQARQHFDYHAIISVGVLFAVLTGVGSWFFGAPFLTSANEYVTVPPLTPVHLASAIPFDLGVFLTVVGSVMLALASLSRIGRRAGEGVNITPMDVDPREAGDSAKEAR